MELMEIRRRILMMPHVRTIGGLIVLIDNFRYSAQNGTFDSSGTIDGDYFITGWFDTGSTSSKSYRLAQDANADYMAARWFNDISARSVDYWRPNKGNEKVFSSAGRFIAATIYKPTAANYFLFDNTNNRYVIRGKNVA